MMRAFIGAACRENPNTDATRRSNGFIIVNVFRFYKDASLWASAAIWGCPIEPRPRPIDEPVTEWKGFQLPSRRDAFEEVIDKLRFIEARQIKGQILLNLAPNIAADLADNLLIDLAGSGEKAAFHDFEP